MDAGAEVNGNYGPFEENMGRESIILRPPHAFR